MTLTPKIETALAALVAKDATDAEIDAALAEGKGNWTLRYASFAARVAAGKYPDRRGLFADPKDVRSSDVAAVLAEYRSANGGKELRGRALPAVFGFAPTAATVARLSSFAPAAKRGGRLTAGKYRATAS